MRVARFLSLTFLFLPILLCLSGSASLSTQKPVLSSPENSIWIVRDLLLSKDRIDKAILDMADAGLTRAFIQVSARLHSYFPSDVLPIAQEVIERGDLEDPFVYFLERAHRAGIEVHAWVNTLYAWSTEGRPVSKEHAFNRHHEWFVHDGRGASMRYAPLESLLARDIPGFFLSPAPPALTELLARYLTEIMRKYDVDGIHLDYIRYPARDAGFGPMERTSFERRYYVDPLSLFTPDSTASLVRRFGETGVRDLKGRWEDFRAVLVTELVRSLKKSLEGSGRTIALSAAVLTNPDSSRVVYGQDWAAWIDEGLVDFVVMMNYTKSTRNFLAALEHPVVASRARHIVVGVSTFNQEMEEAAGKARLALERGMAGVCFFSYNDLSARAEGLPALKRYIKQAR